MGPDAKFIRFLREMSWRSDRVRVHAGRTWRRGRKRLWVHWGVVLNINKEGAVTSVRYGLCMVFTFDTA